MPNASGTAPTQKSTTKSYKRAASEISPIQAGMWIGSNLDHACSGTAQYKSSTASREESLRYEFFLSKSRNSVAAAIHMAMYNLKTQETEIRCFGHMSLGDYHDPVKQETKMSMSFLSCVPRDHFNGNPTPLGVFRPMNWLARHIAWAFMDMKHTSFGLQVDTDHCRIFPATPSYFVATQHLHQHSTLLAAKSCVECAEAMTEADKFMLVKKPKAENKLVIVSARQQRALLEKSIKGAGAPVYPEVTV